MAYPLGAQHYNIIEILVLSLNWFPSVEEVRKLDFVFILELSFLHEDIHLLHTLDPPIFFTDCIDSYDQIFKFEFEMEGFFHYFLNVLLP